MRKRLFGLLFIVAALALVLFAGTTTASAATYSGYCGGEGDGTNLRWELNTDIGVLTISGTGEMKDYDSIDMPWYSYKSDITCVILESGVTTIGEDAFYNCDALVSVALPNGLTTIGASAFSSCDALGILTLPEGLTTIGENAFESCKVLTSVMLPDSLTTIEAGAFWKCSLLTIIDLPAGLTSIGSYAFSQSGIMEITIPAAMTTIGTAVFYCCDALTTVELPRGLTYIGGNAFQACEALESVTLSDEMTHSDGVMRSDGKVGIDIHAFQGCPVLKSVTLPDGLTSIGRNAFYDCKALESVTLPKSLTTIGRSAFQYCSSLMSITIPESVTTIDGNAFRGCTLLTKVNIPAGVTSIGAYTFYETAITKITIPDGVTTIGEYAFYNCACLKSVTLPDSITVIGAYAFYNCALTSVNLPDKLTTLGEWAFAFCDMKSLTIPGSVTSIGADAFHYCLSMTTLTILDGVTNIGDKAFYHCTKLESVTLPDSVLVIGESAFDYEYTYYAISDVYYYGTQEQQEELAIKPRNYMLTDADWHYMAASYTSNGNKTHSIQDTCTECGKTLGEAVISNCVDEDGDEICDICNGELCLHESSSLVSAASNDDGTHTAKQVCDICGKTLNEAVISDCVDEDGDYLCDLCGWENCPHENTYITYRNNANGTHTVRQVCDHCCDTVQTEIEVCIDFNADGKCELCRTIIPVCEHENVNYTYTPNGDETHLVTGVCEDCGKTITTETEFCNDVNADRACELCGGAVAEIVKISLAGANMTLGNDLKLNFLVKASDLDTSKTYTAKIYHGDRDPVEATLQKYNNTYWYVAYGVAAKEMSDLIEVEVYNEAGKLISEPFSRSVKTYAMTLMNPAISGELLKSTVVDMLNYGTEAQKYFGYNETAYANADLTPEQQAQYASVDVACTNRQVAGTNFVGANLSLEDSILLNVFFSSTTTDGMTAAISFVDYKGKEITAEAEVIKHNASMVKVVVDEIVLADAKRPVTVTVYKNGTVFGSGVESVESYVARNLESESTGSINMAIMKFATSAYNYLGGTN